MQMDASICNFHLCKEVTEGENARVQKEKHTGKQIEVGISKALYSFTHFEVIALPWHNIE